MSTPTEPRRRWWGWLTWPGTWPREALSQVQADVSYLRLFVTTDVITRLSRMEINMSADRELLAEIARGLTLLSTPVANLIAANATLRELVAGLEGDAAADEAGDLEAAQAVKVAFDDIADRFRSEPEVPDVDPLPEVPADEPEPPAAA